jgi:hypothetical protein
MTKLNNLFLISFTEYTWFNLELKVPKGFMNMHKRLQRLPFHLDLFLSKSKFS